MSTEHRFGNGFPPPSSSPFKPIPFNVEEWSSSMDRESLFVFLVVHSLLLLSGPEGRFCYRETASFFPFNLSSSLPFGGATAVGASV